MPSLILHVDDAWISPYVFSCFVALQEKQLPFETREHSLSRGDLKQPEYRDRSLTGRVPALEHDGFWVSESMAICEYLAETFPFPLHPRLFPADLRERARCRQLMDWIRSDLQPIRVERSTATMFHRRATEPLSPAASAEAERVLRVAGLVIPEGRTQLFEQWCLADSDLAFFLQRLGLNGHSLPPKVRAFVDAQWSRPSVRAFVERKRGGDIA